MKEKKVDEIENEFRARGEKRLGEERRGGDRGTGGDLAHLRDEFVVISEMSTAVNARVSAVTGR